MRFDDRLATVLAREPKTPVARARQWRQLLDILAQCGVGDAMPAALARFRALRDDVDLAVRRDAVAAIASRPLDPALVGLLADDLPMVAGALLSEVRLAEAGWLDLLPRLGPTGRGFLRHRRDLDPRVTAALASFGTTDFAIAGARGETPAEPMPDDASAAPAVRTDHQRRGAGPDHAGPFEPEPGEGQIRAILSRIATYRNGRDDAPPVPAAPDEFRFETGPSGVIAWVDGVPRSALIGETIAVPAEGPYGVDAQAPGAFRRRAAFRDARLTVAGEGAASGEWRIAGVPAFSPDDHRFLGYRCTARRPRAGETAATTVDPDTLRQLVHELRTPINAIGGFAEMIRRQMRGPVSEAYRDRADSIVGEAARLMTAVDDLDISARLTSDRLVLQPLPIDLPALAEAVVAERGDTAVLPVVRANVALPSAVGDIAAIRRIVARLLAATTALAAPGEPMTVTVSYGPGGMIELAVPRPARLRAIAEADLFDPDFETVGDWPDAPLLGLGFSLYLIRRLVTAGGGALVIEADRFLLHLPAARAGHDDDLLHG